MIQGFASILFISFGISEIIDSGQGIHFPSQNRQCWALEEDIQCNFHVPCRPQAASLIERLNGPFKEVQREQIAPCDCHRYGLV